MINFRKDLRSGRPLWADSSRTGVPHAVSPPRRFWDVVVVGAGISGALVAYRLSRMGKSVLVLDRRPPVSGSTLASTALIQWEIDEPLTALADKLGSRHAFEAYRAAFEAVSGLKRTIAEARIPCRWNDREAVYLAGDGLGHRALQEEERLRRRAGLPSRYVDGNSLLAEAGFDRTGALVSEGAGEVDPAQLAAGLLRRAVENGAVVASPVEITTAECGGGVVALGDAEGRIHLARRAIFATGYETLKSIPADAFSIISTWAIATTPVKGAPWPKRRIVWEASDPYLYLRTTADGRIVAGGEDADFSTPKARDKAIDRKSRTIARKLAKLLPHVEFDVAYAWTGCFAESPTGLPYIAEPPGFPGCLAVLGSGGNGITFSMVASDIAADWVDGRRHPAAHLFEGEA
ncbi:MAG: NAD(P)/FAD-dependent oxidoreductase [Parvibaculaceae bacterium]